MVSYKKFYREHAIIDANVIIDLHEVKALSLLDRIFAQIVPAEQVVRFELQTVELTNLPFEQGNITSAEGYGLFLQLGEQYMQLSQYDREILAIAHEKDLICVTNELPMRRLVANTILRLLAR